MIYVDAIVFYPDCKLPYKRWCHMATDGDIEELHAMAKKLGIRQWFQDKPLHPHYDLVPSKRIQALSYKKNVQAVSAKELNERCFPELAAIGRKLVEDCIELAQIEIITQETLF